ncbi:retrovirus-related pol polyprotein from transposon TNT 1-94 [Tanacetum coccineum]
MESQSETTQTVSTLKLPILKIGDYDLWSMRMEKYLTHTNYALWEVIMNGDAPAIALASAGTEGPIPPKTAEQKLARKNELKAKSTLFGGNKESKNIQKTIQKQQYEHFATSRSVKDSIKPMIAWNNIALIMRNKADLDELSMDDLCNAYVEGEEILKDDRKELNFKEEYGNRNGMCSQKDLSSGGSTNALVNTRCIYPLNSHKKRSSYSTAEGKGENVVKSSACLIWRPIGKGNLQYALQDQGIFDSGCSRHMTGNKSYLTDYQDINGGFVAFVGSPKGGKFTRKGKIRTGKLDFEDLYFVKELKFNLFSVSQMCDKKISVLFTETECLVLSPDFKLLDESQVLLKVPKTENMYSLTEEYVIMNSSLIINDMNQFLWDLKGIKEGFSVARTPQQNGVADRKNRTLIEADRTMLADSLLPTTFWAEAVNTICYVQNRVLVDQAQIIKKPNKNEVSMDNVDVCTYSHISATLLLDSLHRAKDAVAMMLVKRPMKNQYMRVKEMVKRKKEELQIKKMTRMFKILEHNWIICLFKEGKVMLTALTEIVLGAYDDEDVGTKADLNNLETTMNIQDDRAMQEELLHFKPSKRLGTFGRSSKDKRAIGTKWVYRNKKDKRGIVVRNKARLVAQGYTQGEGIDYDEVFAPVANPGKLYTTSRTIEEEVYVCQPPGFEDPQFPDKVYKVEKALYGLHQAPRACYKTLSTYLLENRYKRGTIDKTLFIKKDRGDILTPIETNKALNKDEEVEDIDVYLYRSMIGSLMYLTASRPDLMFAVCAYARFQATPKTSHLYAVKGIFRYLKGQPKLGLWYLRDSPFDLEAFSDSDYAGASLDRKSTIGDETVYKEWADRMERAATTASSLEAEQDNGNINKTQSMSTLNESFPQGTDSGSGPRIGVDTARHKLNTASISTLENGDMEITAIIDGKVKVVSEASIRRHLKLEDSDGIKENFDYLGAKLHMAST